MKNLEILSKDQVNNDNAQIFDALKGKLGMVPNLYATIANSEVALGTFLTAGDSLANGSFNGKEVEAIALAAAEANGCEYCLAAHTAVGKLNGFSEQDTIDIRSGQVNDTKLQALINLTTAIVKDHGRPNQILVDAFFSAGYNQAALIDLIGFVALNTFNNYVNNIAKTTIDFPAAPELSLAV